MNAVADNLVTVRAGIPEGVTLVAVSKFHPAEVLRQAYDAGQRHFGESRVQELCAKAAVLPGDICWHFIGHLQTNKVRRVVGVATLIESIDSERLLRCVDEAAAAAGTVARVLMQVHVAAEETKFGFVPDELLDFFAQRRFETLRATHICGLMAMASNTDDADRVRCDFETVATLKNRIIEMCPDLRGFDTLSMGVSHDFRAAIAAGSTEVRVGTAIFGEREY